MSAATARKAVLDEVADRILEQRAEIEAEQKALAAEAAAEDERVKALYMAYLEARELYSVKQAELMKLLPQIAEFIGEVADARIAQEDAVRAGQKAGLGEGLPAKILDLEMRAAREGYTGA